ncbi:MAG TPA: ATP synthase F1 subunit delta [Chitinophagaceae bacterium]|nr:ATP synthase F1 subunit delta [Chitinophagaceae bacterium]
MLNPRLAGRYAKSLMDLAIERNELEAIYQDMQFLQSVCRNSRDFVNLMKSPVIAPDKKEGIFNAVTKGKISALTASFHQLLIRKGREANFPEIVQAFIDQYKRHKGIYTVKLTTAKPVSEDLKQEIIRKVRSQTPMQNIELKTEVKEDLVGGFVLEMGDTLVDASIAYDLKAIKKQFLNNDFIYKIR